MSLRSHVDCPAALDEHFRVEGRRTWFETIDEMQAVLDDFLVGYNQRRPHQGRNMKIRISSLDMSLILE